MVVYARDSKGRFARRPEGVHSRRAISGRGVSGAIRFANQRQAGGWVMDAYTNLALTRHQAETIFRARGGSRKFFAQMWKQQSRHPKDATPEQRKRPTRAQEARRLSLKNQRKAAKEAGVPFRVWRQRHYKGSKLFWEGADRDEWIAEWYPEIDASQETKGA